jgi:hypothetical protein
MTQLNANPLTQAEQAQFLSTIGSSDEKDHLPDWAESLTQARIALRALDDAFPGQDAEKVKEAHKSLTTAANRIRMFMVLRGVEPLV